MEIKEKLIKHIIKDRHYTEIETQAAVYFIDYLLQLPESLTEKLRKSMVKVIEKEGPDMVQHNSGEWSPTMEAVFSHIREDAEKVGIQKGKEQTLKKVALELLKSGGSVEYVVEITGMDSAVIEKLKEEL